MCCHLEEDRKYCCFKQLSQMSYKIETKKQKNENKRNIITGFSDIIKMCHKINLIDIINHLNSHTKPENTNFVSTFSYRGTIRS